jgi:hypothetical protein
MGQKLQIAGMWAMGAIVLGACGVAGLRTRELLVGVEGWPLPLRLPPVPLLAEDPGAIALREIPTLVLVFLANLAGVLTPVLVLWIAFRLIRAWIARRSAAQQAEHQKEQDDA